MIRHLQPFALVCGAACFLAATLAAASPTSAPADDAPPSGAPAAESVDALLDRLDSPLHAERLAASELLLAQGGALFELLERGRMPLRSFEARRRARQVAEQVYLEERLGPSPPFLGIQYPRDDESDPRLLLEKPVENATRVGVLVEGVIERTAAEEAKLKRGDYVVAVNDKPLLRSASSRAFADWISTQRAGTRCTLTLYRGTKRMKVSAVLKRRPLHLGATWNAPPEKQVAVREEFVTFYRKIDPGVEMTPLQPADRSPAWRLTPGR